MFTELTPSHKFTVGERTSIGQEVSSVGVYYYWLIETFRDSFFNLFYFITIIIIIFFYLLCYVFSSFFTQPHLSTCNLQRLGMQALL